MKRVSLLVVAGWVAGLAGALGCEGGAKEAAPQAAAGKAEGENWMDFIKLQAVEPSRGVSTVTLTGKVSFDEDHTQRVASPVDGRVVRVDVKLGDHVKAGQSLVELLSPQVAQIQSDAQKAEQDFSVAEKSVQRVEKLKADGAVSEKEVAQAHADFQKARSDLERAQSQLRVLSLTGAHTASSVGLHSQLPGTVVERNVLVGQEVRGDAAQSLLTVTNLSTVWVLADVYEQDLGLVSMGAEVTVKVPAYPNESFAGKILYVGEVVDATSRTVKVRCVVPNQDGRLKPEMFAKVELKDDGNHPTLRVPDKAVLLDGDKSEVVLAVKGKFQLRSVHVGPEVDGYIRILEGLEPGDVVVTDGALFIKRELQD